MAFGVGEKDVFLIPVAYPGEEDPARLESAGIGVRAEKDLFRADLFYGVFDDVIEKRAPARRVGIDVPVLRVSDRLDVFVAAEMSDDEVHIGIFVGEAHHARYFIVVHKNEAFQLVCEREYRVAVFEDVVFMLKALYLYPEDFSAADHFSYLREKIFLPRIEHKPLIYPVVVFRLTIQYLIALVYVFRAGDGGEMRKRARDDAAVFVFLHQKFKIPLVHIRVGDVGGKARVEMAVDIKFFHIFSIAFPVRSGL